MMNKTVQFFLIILLLSCFSCQNKVLTADQVYTIAKSYLSSKWDQKKTIDNQSFVMFTTPDSISYLFKKANICIGDLNNDGSQDAIISYVVISKDKPFFTKHIIFLNEKSGLKPVKEIQMEIIISKIIDGVVYAEKSKIATDAPNYGCQSCMEKINYRFEKDSLIQITK